MPFRLKATFRYPALMLVAATLSACNPIEGELEVLRQTTLIGMHSIEDDCSFEALPVDCHQTVTNGAQQLKPGAFQASVDFTSKHDVTVSLHEEQQKRAFKFTFPAGFSVPKERGRFHLSAREVGQPVALTGDVDTQHVMSAPQAAWESCSYTVTRWICENPPLHQHKRHRSKHHRQGHSARGHRPKAQRSNYVRTERRQARRQHCGYQEVAIRGQRSVDFQFERTTKTLKLTLEQPRTTLTLATFSGQLVERQKHYRSRSECR